MTHPASCVLQPRMLRLQHGLSFEPHHRLRARLFFRIRLHDAIVAGACVHRYIVRRRSHDVPGSLRECFLEAIHRFTARGIVVGSAGKPAKNSRTAGKLMACGKASRKCLTDSTSYSSAPTTWGSRVGTRISQITRRPSLASQRIIVSASTS
eukprot:604832-Pleurochrysis_carterae.AAC.3